MDRLREALRIISDVQVDLAFAQYVREEYLPRVVRNAAKRLAEAIKMLDQEIPKVERAMNGLAFLGKTTFDAYKYHDENLRRMRKENPEWMNTKEHEEISLLVDFIGETNDYIASLLGWEEEAIVKARGEAQT